MKNSLSMPKTARTSPIVRSVAPERNESKADAIISHARKQQVNVSDPIKVIDCRRCNYQWCWLCGQRFKEDHFDKWNVFGCSGMQHLDTSKCKVITFATITIFLVPFILIWKPIRVLLKSFKEPLYFPQRWRWCCPCQLWMVAADNRSCCCKLCTCITIFSLLLPLVFLVGLVLGLINMAIFVVPAMLYQIYRLLRIIFNRCPCLVK